MRRAIVGNGRAKIKKWTRAIASRIKQKRSFSHQEKKRPVSFKQLVENKSDFSVKNSQHLRVYASTNAKCHSGPDNRNTQGRRIDTRAFRYREQKLSLSQTSHVFYAHVILFIPEAGSCSRTADCLVMCWTKPLVLLYRSTDLTLTFTVTTQVGSTFADDLSLSTSNI